ncbi:MAG: glycosyl hydrolase 108 family protein [Novosphingobium sp.]|nr:glycosyl hydrolase 108 family protein [Novosphingobium sp.]
MSKGKIIGGAIGAVAAILAGIYAHEGGYVNHPNDPGGPTRYGVTEQVARAAGYGGDMRHFPLHCTGSAETCADEIYIGRYMKQPGYWPLIVIEPAVAEELIDTAVNMGAPRPSKWFQQSINELCGTRLTVDGKVGPKTRSAYERCRSAKGPQVCVAMLDRLDARQLAEYDRLVRVNPSLKVFHRGWTRQRIGNVDRAKCAA